VRASIAIAGLFTPVWHEGDLLIDGGYLNNLPIDVMREGCDGGPVVAVNVSPVRDPVIADDLGPSLSGWDVLRRRVSPFNRPFQVPSIAAMILRSSAIGGTHRLATSGRLADLLISPPVAGFRIHDFAAHEGLIEIGYETARRDLATWLAATGADPVITMPMGREERLRGEVALIPD
jgi:predicted acylesterase/phospholipase RssA